jgi:hypothetical protein
VDGEILAFDSFVGPLGGSSALRKLNSGTAAGPHPMYLFEPGAAGERTISLSYISYCQGAGEETAVTFAVDVVEIS